MAQATRRVAWGHHFLHIETGRKVRRIDMRQLLGSRVCGMRAPGGPRRRGVGMQVDATDRRRFRPAPGRRRIKRG